MLLTASCLTCSIASACSTVDPPAEAARGSVQSIRVNDFTFGAQHEVVIDADALGAVVAWSSRRQRGGRSGVALRLLELDGTPRTDELLAGTDHDGHQTQPSVASDGQGGAWLAWRAHGADGDNGSIVLRRFDHSGAGHPPVIVNERVRGSQDAPVVVALGPGAVAVAWTSDRTERTEAAPEGSTASVGGAPPLSGGVPGLQRVAFRAFGGAGVPSSPEVLLSLPEAPYGANPTLVALDGELVLVAWTALDASGAPQGVAKAIVDPAGAIVVQPEMIELAARQSAIEPTLSWGGDGEGLAIGWLVASADGHEAVVVPLNAHGCPMGEPVSLAGATGRQNGLSLCALPDGRLGYALNEFDAGASTVRIGRIDPARGTVTTDARLGAGTTGAGIRQASGTRHLALIGEAMAVTWSGDGRLGDPSGAHLALVHPDSRGGIRHGGDFIASDLRRGADSQDPEAIDATDLPFDKRITAAPHDPPIFREPPLDSEAEGGSSRRFSSFDDGVGFDVVIDTGWFPPDPTLAVGPSHLVGMTNGAIRVLDKQGTILLAAKIEGSGGFWGSLGATNFVFDPEALYDWHSGRYWAMASEANAPGGKSYVLIAVSATEDPAGAWHKFRIETTSLSSNNFDSPNIGVNETTVFIAGDGPGSVQKYPMFIFDKASMLQGLPPAATNSFLLPTTTESAGFSPVTPASSAALYLVEHKEASSNSAVRIISLRDALGVPIIDSVDVPVPAYQNPPEDPPQAGTSMRPETFDARFWSVCHAGNSLWATHHAGTDRVLVRWYEFAISGWPLSGSLPTLAQSGTIDPGPTVGPTVRTYFSAITADAAGNAALTFARSSPTEFISMQVALRVAGDPPGTFRTPTQEKINTAGYVGNRWGDYAGVGFDPSEPGAVWAHHQYAIGNSWRTWATKRTLPPPTADLDGDGDVDGADLGLLLGAWGTAGPGDLDGDGVVDGTDLELLLAAWG